MSKQVKPRGWHEFVPGERDLNGNVHCDVCGHLYPISDHRRCKDCGDYDIYLVCGAGCSEARCKKCAEGHWCSSLEASAREWGR
jgi:hypothetical protein